MTWTFWKLIFLHFQYSCGSRTNKNSTYFVNDNFPSGYNNIGQCSITIEKVAFCFLVLTMLHHHREVCFLFLSFDNAPSPSRRFFLIFLMCQIFFYDPVCNFQFCISYYTVHFALCTLHVLSLSGKVSLSLSLSWGFYSYNIAVLPAVPLGFEPLTFYVLFMCLQVESNVCQLRLDLGVQIFFVIFITILTF